MSVNETFKNESLRLYLKLIDFKSQPNSGWSTQQRELSKHKVGDNLISLDT